MKFSVTREENCREDKRNQNENCYMNPEEVEHRLLCCPEKVWNKIEIVRTLDTLAKAGSAAKAAAKIKPDRLSSVKAEARPTRQNFI